MHCVRLAALVLISTNLHGQISPRRRLVIPSALPPATCPAPRDSAYSATVAVSPVARNARTAVATVCLGVAPMLTSVARYAGTLRFPTSMAVFDSASLPVGAAQDVDASTPGVVGFSGDQPSGLPTGALLSVRLRLLKPGVMPVVALRITDLQTTGESAIPLLWVQDRAPFRLLPRRPGGGGVRLDRPTTSAEDSTPRISALDRLSVAAGIMETGQMVNVTIGGANFDRTNNTVMFGPVAIANLPAELGVLIRFAVPTTTPSGGGAAPIMLGAGDYPITVKTSHGTSNAIVFHITRLAPETGAVGTAGRMVRFDALTLPLAWIGHTSRRILPATRR